MGELLSMPARTQKADRRRTPGHDFVQGQQWIANAIFHWKDDPGDDARAAVKFLMRHLATRFRSDDEPLQPRPLETAAPKTPTQLRKSRTVSKKAPRDEPQG